MIEFISNLLMVCLFVYLAAFAINIFLRVKTIESALRYYYLGIAAYFIFFIISQSIFVVNDLVVTEDTRLYDALYLTGNFLGHIGLIVLMFVVEKNVYDKLKFIPTILILISAILEIIFFDYMFFFVILLLIVATLIPIIYIRVAFQTTGTTRLKGLLHGTGLIVFMLGILFNSYTFLSISKVFYIIGPTMEIAGAVIFHYALLYYART